MRLQSQTYAAKWMRKSRENGSEYSKRQRQYSTKPRTTDQKLKAAAKINAFKLWLKAYKVEHGCIDCGYNEHPDALQFDHVRGEKYINVGSLSGSPNAAIREIAKCEVRCANCHAKKTVAAHNGWTRRAAYTTAAPIDPQILTLLAPSDFMLMLT